VDALRHLSKNNRPTCLFVTLSPVTSPGSRGRGSIVVVLLKQIPTFGPQLCSFMSLFLLRITALSFPLPYSLFIRLCAEYDFIAALFFPLDLNPSPADVAFFSRFLLQTTIYFLMSFSNEALPCVYQTLVFLRVSADLVIERPTPACYPV